MIYSTGIYSHRFFTKEYVSPGGIQVKLADDSEVVVPTFPYWTYGLDGVTCQKQVGAAFEKEMGHKPKHVVSIANENAPGVLGFIATDHAVLNGRTDY